jgi:hypothetical protein
MRDAMRQLDELQVPDNPWANIRGRAVPPVPPGPKRTRRLTVGLVALGVSFASIVFLVSSFGSVDTAPFEVPSPAATPEPPQTFDGWRVGVSGSPLRFGPLRFTVGPIASAPKSAKNGWIQHTLTIENTGDRPVTLADRRTSVFLGPPPKSLLVADWSCGYASAQSGAPVHAGACLSYLDQHVLRPGDHITRTISLLKELPGMARLTSGTYVFDQPVGYYVSNARVREGHVRLVYTIDVVAPLAFAPANGWYEQTFAGRTGGSDPSQAWTSNQPFPANARAPVFPDPTWLPEDGVLVVAWEVIQAPPDPRNPNFPQIEGAIPLSEPDEDYEGASVGVARSQMLAQANGRYIQVRVFFGSPHPGDGALAAAQSALDRLVVTEPG